MKKRRGFFLCVLGLLISASPLFMEGGKVYSILGIALVIFGVVANGLDQSRTRKEKKPLDKVKIIQLCCLTASLMVILFSALLQLDPVTLRTRARPLSMLLTMIAFFIPQIMNEKPDDVS